MCKKTLFLLLFALAFPVFADSTKMKPSNVQPKSNILWQTSDHVSIPDKTLRLLETVPACPSHLKPKITVSLESITPLVGCNSSNLAKTCFINELHMNVYVDSTGNTYKIMSNNSYAYVMSRDGVVSGSASISVNYVLSCVV